MNNEIREHYLKLALVVSGIAFLPHCSAHTSDRCCKESCTKP